MLFILFLTVSSESAVTGHSWRSDTSKNGLLLWAVGRVLSLKKSIFAYLFRIMDLARFRDGKQFPSGQNGLHVTSFLLTQHGENLVCKYCLMHLAEEWVYGPWNQRLPHWSLPEWDIDHFQSLHMIHKLAFMLV